MSARSSPTTASTSSRRIASSNRRWPVVRCSTSAPMSRPLRTWVLGPALAVKASGEMTASGVNGQTGMVLTHAGDATSVLHTTPAHAYAPHPPSIAGTRATLTLPGPFFQPGDVIVTSHRRLTHGAVGPIPSRGRALLRSTTVPSRWLARSTPAISARRCTHPPPCSPTCVPSTRPPDRSESATTRGDAPCRDLSGTRTTTRCLAIAKRYEMRS